MSILAASCFIFLTVSTAGAEMTTAQKEDCIRRAVEMIDTGKRNFDRYLLEEGIQLLAELQERAGECALSQFHRAVGYSVLASISDHERHSEQAEKEIRSGIASAERAVQLNPNHSESHRLLGSLYGRLIGMKSGIARATYGALYGARSNQALERALALDPKNAEAYLAKGIAKMKTPALFGGDLDVAVELFGKALELSPDSEDARIWLGIACRMKGNTLESRQWFMSVLEMNPNNHWARRELAGTRD